MQAQKPERHYGAFIVLSIIWGALFLFFSPYSAGVTILATIPLLGAILYNGFRREREQRERAVQTEGQLHEMQEQLTKLQEQNARLLALLEGGPAQGPAAQEPTGQEGR